ncbi:MAG: hypothetical protein CMJ18_02495 [Phycisphaeraceae bacterium]|nr:hypothetical protein [Phycisphaeraceae bacterium]
MQTHATLAPDLPPVHRLGLASRGNTHLDADGVHRAIDRGVNYLNWCGHPDGLSQAVGELDAARRAGLVIAMQFSARTADEARRELDASLEMLDTGCIDVITWYYVEHIEEWDRIMGPGGAAETIRAAIEQGAIRRVGLTTHQRPLAAELAATGHLDLLMVRYNAAHRGAEQDVFPVTIARQVPVVAFTCLRWGALSRPTPDDPPGFTPPPAPDWYRFVLANPNVSVALMAPTDHAELEDNLALMDNWSEPDEEELAALRAHGDRVHRHGGAFP